MWDLNIRAAFWITVRMKSTVCGCISEYHPVVCMMWKTWCLLSSTFIVLGLMSWNKAWNSWCNHQNKGSVWQHAGPMYYLFQCGNAPIYFTPAFAIYSGLKYSHPFQRIQKSQENPKDLKCEPSVQPACSCCAASIRYLLRMDVAYSTKGLLQCQLSGLEKEGCADEHDAEYMWVWGCWEPH